jgi:hypothetical protein
MDAKEKTHIKQNQTHKKVAVSEVGNSLFQVSMWFCALLVVKFFDKDVLLQNGPSQLRVAVG